MNQPLNAEIDKYMKHVPESEPEEGVIDCSEKLHRDVYRAAEAFIKHRTSEVHWKPGAKTAGAQEQWEVVGEWSSSESVCCVCSEPQLECHAPSAC